MAQVYLVLRWFCAVASSHRRHPTPTPTPTMHCIRNTLLQASNRRRTTARISHLASRISRCQLPPLVSCTLSCFGSRPGSGTGHRLRSNGPVKTGSSLQRDPKHHVSPGGHRRHQLIACCLVLSEGERSPPPLQKAASSKQTRPFLQNAALRMHLNSTFQIALPDLPPRQLSLLSGPLLGGVTSTRHTLVGLASK